MKRLTLPSAFVTACLLAAAPTVAARAGGRLSAEARFDPPQARVGDTVDLVVTAHVAAGNHTYAPDTPEGGGLPARLEFDTPDGLRPVGGWTFPAPKKRWDPDLEAVVHVHEGDVWYRRRYRVVAVGEFHASGFLDAQVCDARSCVQERIPLTAVLRVSGGAGSSPAAASEPPAAFEPPPPTIGHVTARVVFDPPRASPGGRTTLKLAVRIREGRHLYAPDSPAGLPSRLEVTEAGPLQPTGELRFPPPQVHWSDVFEENEHLFEGTVVFEQDFLVAPDAPLGPVEVKATLSGQTCDEDDCETFDLPLRVAFEVAAPSPAAGGPSPSSPAAPVAAPEAGSSPALGSAPAAGSIERMPLPAFLLLAVFWGVITLLMPCTYPMIPITISFFTKQAIAREGRVLGLSLAYGAGIVVIFVLLGVLLGAPIIAFAQHPVTNLVIGVLFVLFALVLFGALDLQPPRFLLDAAGRASSRGGLLGVFLMGATLVVTSFTCTAPFVGSLLSVGARGGDVGRIVLGMGVFGATMALPFVLLSLLPARLQRMPSAGDWMHTLKVYLGFVEFAAALKFFSNADLIWNWRLLPREVFLALWAGTFFCAAAYLFGWIRLRSESDAGIGPVRLVGGLCSLLLAAYFSLGVFGYVLDDVTTAIAPNYSNGRVFTAGSPQAADGGANLVVDDLEAARRRAVAQGKLLLVNFTGFT